MDFACARENATIKINFLFLIEVGLQARAASKRLLGNSKIRSNTFV